MFTDELMEQKYAETHKSSDALKVLLENLFDAGNESKANSDVAVPTGKIQQAHNIWKLFASRHPEINPNGFKLTLLNSFPEKEYYINSILK